jgi:hypothetical protein
MTTPPPARRRLPGWAIALIVTLAVLVIGAGAIVVGLIVWGANSASTYLSHSGLDDGAGENQRYREAGFDGSQDYLVATPCYAFTGPEGWVNHQKTAYIEDCLTNLELWGTLEPDGSITFTGLPGTVFANETVSPNYANSGTPVPVTADDVTFAGQPARQWTEPLEDRDGDGESDGSAVFVVVDLPTQMSNYWGPFNSITIEARALIGFGDPEQLMSDLERTWTWN